MTIDFLSYIQMHLPNASSELGIKNDFIYEGLAHKGNVKFLFFQFSFYALHAIVSYIIFI